MLRPGRLSTVASGLGAWAAVLLLLACRSEPHTTAVLKLASGEEIRIQLRKDAAPGTVTNFIELAEDGFYDGTTFHVVVPGFMIQGGDPNTKNDFPYDDGFGGPGYTIAYEESPLSHVRGAVSMAHPAGSKDGAGSQFFIMVSETGPDGQSWPEELDGEYTVFGEVIEGMDAVDRIAALPTGRGGELRGQEMRPDEDQVVTSIVVERPGSEGQRSGPGAPTGG